MREFRFFSAIPRGDNKRVTGFKNENEKLDGQLAIGPVKLRENHSENYDKFQPIVSNFFFFFQFEVTHSVIQRRTK